MPARSTPFQKLVLHIQEQLAPAASVSESCLLVHRLTGEKREVDVVVRTSVAKAPVVVCVECIEHERPADVTWVEKMIAKHAHLETNKLVLVSLSGFTQQALVLADKEHASTFTPEEATVADWMSVVGQAVLHVARFDYTPLATSICIESATGPVMFEAGPSTTIVRGDSGAAENLGTIVLRHLNDHDFGGRAMDLQPADGSGTLDLEFQFHDEMFALDEAGTQHRVVKVHAKVKAVRRSAPVSMRSLSFDGVPAAFGAGETPLGSTTLTIVEPGPGTMTARVVADGRTLPTYPATRPVSSAPKEGTPPERSMVPTQQPPNGGR